MKIKGIKKAIGDYQRANKGGYYSPHYGCLMFDKSTGEIWTDEFYSLGHNSWKEYHDDNIINVVNKMAELEGAEIKINTKSVKEFLSNYNGKYKGGF